MLLKEAQADLPYATPDRERLLCYVDEFYYEPSRYSHALSDFLRVKCGAAPEDAENFLSCIYAVMATGLVPPNTIVTALRNEGLQISHGAAQAHAEQLLLDLYRHIPAYLYRGHTPLEAEVLLESEP